MDAQEYKVMRELHILKREEYVKEFWEEQKEYFIEQCDKKLVDAIPDTSIRVSITGLYRLEKCWFRDTKILNNNLMGDLQKYCTRCLAKYYKEKGFDITNDYSSFKVEIK